MEKDLRTRVQVMLKQKRDRQQELKALQEQDRDLCDILCVSPFGIDSNAVPSLEELDRYRRHLASLSAEKVSGGWVRSPWGGGDGAHGLLTGLVTCRSEGERSLSVSSGRSSSAWRSWTTPQTRALSGRWCVRMRKPSACPQTTSLPSRTCCSRYVGTSRQRCCDRGAVEAAWQRGTEHGCSALSNRVVLEPPARSSCTEMWEDERAALLAAAGPAACLVSIGPFWC